MSASTWPELVTALVAAWQADSAIGGDGVLVLDGPTTSSEQNRRVILVGASFDDADEDAGNWQHSYRTSGGFEAAMDEMVSVRCALRYSSGDTSIAGARTAAFALLADCERVVRTNSDLGVASVAWAYLSTGTVKQSLNGGARVTVEFTVNAEAVI